MKKFITLLLAVVTAATCCFAFAACNPDENKTEKTKVGLITLHDDKTSSTLSKPLAKRPA